MYIKGQFLSRVSVDCIVSTLQEDSRMAEGLDLGLKLECTDCPLCDAPGCFRTVLIRALELGSVNYLPTNWQGFAEYFSLGVSASSPKELVNHWTDKHPNRKQHTIRKVLEYAEAKQHNALLQDFKKVLKGEVLVINNKFANCTF